MNTTKQIRNFKYRNELIKNATNSELLFKYKLDRAKIKYKFQKGFIAGDYHCIVDFYLPRPFRLCIEIDGSIHNSPKQILKDIEKDKYLKSRKFKVLRIKNEDVIYFDMKKLLEYNNLKK